MVRLSIVIATYNRGAKLLRTLDSLAMQTMSAREWEVVVVNNNSTDDTRELFERFAAEHPELGLRLVDETRQGLSWARNCGIASSRGSVIAIIDDDEEVNPEFAAVYVDFFDRHPEALLAGGEVVPKYETERPRWMSRFTERPIAGTLNLGEKERPFYKGYPAGGNMAARKEVFERYGMFDTSLGRMGGVLTGGEERELAYRVVKTAGQNAGGSPVWWVPGAIIYHIIPASKLTPDYFSRLSKGVGVSERVRTKALSGADYAMAVVKEIYKWTATIAIAFWFTVSGHSAKAQHLIIMRRGITTGLLGL